MQLQENPRVCSVVYLQVLGGQKGTVSGMGALMSCQRRQESHTCFSEKQDAPILHQQIEKLWIED